MIKEKLIIAGVTVALQLAIFGAGYYKGKLSCVTQASNKVIKEIKDEVQVYADKPKSDDDVIERLCNWAKLRAKDEGKSIKQLSLGACEGI